MRLGAILLSVLLVACGVDNGIVVNNPTPSRTTLTVPPTGSPTASPTSTATPSPTPLISSKGGIVVRQPLANSRVRSPLVISGDASVFEANLIWQITDTAGRVLAGPAITTATAGAPQRGTFTITATYADPASDIIGFAEVFTRSPRDGNIDEIVRVPLVLSAR
jgi:Immunoglobulin-like domain of bacterial spore germination